MGHANSLEGLYHSCLPSWSQILSCRWKKYKFDYRIMTYAVRFHPAILPPQATHQKAKHVLTPRWCITVFWASWDCPGSPLLDCQTKLYLAKILQELFFLTEGHWQDLRKWDSEDMKRLSNRRDFTQGRGTPCLVGGICIGNTAQECSAVSTVLYVAWVRWKTFLSLIT